MGANAVTTVPVYVAGEVLTAADLNITNSGIPVFATTVTRDAAFGGTGEKVLAEGQFAYLESTNATQYYDGAAWQSVGITPGLIPIVPTSVTLGGGTATTSTNGQVAFTSATTSILLNGVFSATYTNYKIVVANTFDGAGGQVTGRLSVGGTPSTATQYRTNRVYAAGGVAYAENTAAQTSFAFTIGGVKKQNISLDIINPFIATQTMALGTLGGSETDGTAGDVTAANYMNQAATSYDGIQILISGAVTGTISVYGYNQ